MDEQVEFRILQALDENMQPVEMYGHVRVLPICYALPDGYYTIFRGVKYGITWIGLSWHISHKICDISVS